MQLKVGEIVEGKVVSVKDYGVFVSIGEELSGMVHISEVANDYVNNINDFIKLGDIVKAKVINIGEDNKISLSIKKATPKPQKTYNPKFGENRKAGKPNPNFEWAPQKTEPASFEEMMNKFKASSDEKFSDLKRKNPEVRRSKRGANNR
ncbi:MAG: S1 RNA-binding domain-containing protein [Clostridia bacterium]|nr:S1 RNA-binding domain-containing protein [Clostridia bacterium]